MNGLISMTNIALDWSASAMTLAFYAGANAALLATAVLVIDALFRRWLSSRQMGLLWGIVLLRLLIPVGPSSSFSLQNLLPTTQSERSVPSDPTREPSANSRNLAYSQPRGTISRDPISSVSVAATQAIGVSLAVELFLTVFPSVCIFGGVTSFVWTMIAHWRFCRQLQQVPPCGDQRLRHMHGRKSDIIGAGRRNPAGMMIEYRGIYQRRSLNSSRE